MPRIERAHRRHKPGTPIIGSDELAAVDAGRSVGDKVWLEVPRFGSAAGITAGGIVLAGRTQATSESLDRAAVVLAVGETCPGEIQRGMVANFHRYVELAPEDLHERQRFHRINDELRAAMREQHDLPERGTDEWEPEHDERREFLEGRIEALKNQRPTPRQFRGQNFRTVDGRNLICLPWQCIHAVHEPETAAVA